MPDHGGGSREPPRLHLAPGERSRHSRTWATTPSGNRATAVGACVLLALAATLVAVFIMRLIDRLSIAPNPPDWPAVGLLALFSLLASWAAAATTARAGGVTWTLDRTARTITRTRTSLFGAHTARTWYDHDVADIRRDDSTRGGIPYAAVTLDLAHGGHVTIGEGRELHLVSQLTADLRWALHRDREPPA